MIVQREFRRDQEIITSEDIEVVTGLDSEGAIREYVYLLNILNSGTNELLLDDYCRLKGFDSEEVFFTLNPPDIEWIIEFEDEFQLELDQHYNKSDSHGDIISH